MPEVARESLQPGQRYTLVERAKPERPRRTYTFHFLEMGGELPMFRTAAGDAALAENPQHILTAMEKVSKPSDQYAFYAEGDPNIPPQVAINQNVVMQAGGVRRRRKGGRKSRKATKRSRKATKRSRKH